jgi:hypothetical protein
LDIVSYPCIARFPADYAGKPAYRCDRYNRTNRTSRWGLPDIDSAQILRATCDAIAAALAFVVIVRGHDRRLRRTIPKAPAEHRGGDRSD